MRHAKIESELFVSNRKRLTSLLMSDALAVVNANTILEAGFAQPAELLQVIDQFETWSQICLKHLFGGG